MKQKTLRSYANRQLYVFAGLGTTGASVLAVGSTAHAQTIISDTFTSGSNYGTTLGGISPAPGLSVNGTNLPGGTWQYEGDNGGGQGGQAEISGAGNGAKIGTVRNYARSHNSSSAAISLQSSGSYVEPTNLMLSATVNPIVGAANTSPKANLFYVGYFNAVSTSNYTAPIPGQTAQAAIVGLAVDSTGLLDYAVNGTLTATGIAPGTSIFDASGFTTLSYQFSFDRTSKLGTFSNIILNGTSYPNTFTTGVLSPNTINYAGFSSNVGGGSGAMSSFTISGVAVPEPSTYALLAAGAVAAGATVQFRRRVSA